MSVDLSRLKSYAPQARKDFMKAVTERAARIGITANGIVEAERRGDVVVIGGAAYDKTFGKQRDALVSKVKIEGFDQVIEGIAYTWFNRLVALRFMELHEYLDHGFQIVGPGKAGGPLPEALVNAELLNLPRLPVEHVREMKITGDYEEKLYRAILIAQCNALSETMGFMFEKIGDATELLLPDNLLATDGLVRKLVQNSDAESWQNVEVIGWLYQFYISEKKDDVFKALKKNVKISAANIPAATQLFTPHWIVRYLIENSLGRLWLLNNPSSKLAEKMDYYIAPQEPETDFLKIGSPEEIKICDPACGSGHMLTYAFDLLYSIYEEAGYRSRDIAACILEKNLQGIEIDGRAGALSAFCLVMKARAQDPRFFKRRVAPRICILEDVAFSETEKEDVIAVAGKDLFSCKFWETLSQFEQAKNFGSLIVPKLRNPVETLRVIEARDFESDLLLKEVQARVTTVLRMAEALSPKYHVVVANPPYMTLGNANSFLNKWTKSTFPNSSGDLFSAFIERGLMLALDCGYSAMITMQTWLFISSYKKLREIMISNSQFIGLINIGYNTFPEMNSKVALGAAFVINKSTSDIAGTYIDLNKAPQSVDKEGVFLKEKIGSENQYLRRMSVFQKIPGSPFAFWVTEPVYKAFNGEIIGEKFEVKGGMSTSDNDRFLRIWSEVSQIHCSLPLDKEPAENARWFPYNKGGGFRKWFGNWEYLVNWENEGSDIKHAVCNNPKDPDTTHWSRRIFNTEYFFQRGLTWGDVTTGPFSARLLERGAISDSVGIAAYRCQSETVEWAALAALNAKTLKFFTDILCPTIHFNSGPMSKIPLPEKDGWVSEGSKLAQTLTLLARSDWDAYETSWDFTTLPLLSSDYRSATLEDSYTTLRSHWQSMTDEMKALEEENNRIFIDAYGLQDEIDEKVLIEEITLTSNPAYRYGVKGTSEEREELLKRDTMRELISYAIGCIMGRYSLVEPGLAYANAGNIGFDPTKYGHFPADDDGIVPVADIEWFRDDAAARFFEFISQTFSGEKLGENLDFIADAIEPIRKLSATDTVRKYIARSFFKDHLKTYKNRPIYWLFSSGKERAFECLVYLHRYNEGTLGRMRAEYVIPLQTKMQNRIQTIGGEIGRGDLSSAQMKARTKELATLEAKKTELDRFEADLRHMAEERITLDLDDGVKVNYGKFGTLLAETKLVCGTKDAE
ncbi:hypothetical protein FP2506_01060 [Fulvimarina pelagi HTCC2506]|uniref:site-specific DNA-methyltransferase (adenine-specific) n=1 Tax=Fulvimarina pelagi HTCC2506 TaxID=314231 RepID=Q0G285_9HYPH|nr:BREX-1 system adenine-specific DNA-methyltransferase PglX [Fulvimarina pelagi]EAU41313.1 hypothetical protein FP2506_01060 [Fulvimarina pelagi HTCC2506]